MITWFGRCAVPGVDENGTVAPWNSPEVMASVPLNKDGALDSCQLIDVTTNSSVKCNRWVYDKIYYQSSKAIEVHHSKQHRELCLGGCYFSFTFLML
jgi:hypothetical protein